MRKLKFAIAGLVALICAGPAWAVVGETTIKVADGATAIPQATITVTFKSQAGKPLRTVKRTPARSGPRAGTSKVVIPDNTETVDITVTTANGRTRTRTDLDVASLINNEIVIDIPGGASPQTDRPTPRIGSPDTPVPVLVYPSPAGVPIAFGGSVTRIPQVSGGTRFDGFGEVPIVASRRIIPGASGAVDVILPADRFFFSNSYFNVAVGFNTFDDNVSGSVPVGTSSAFTYIFVNPASGSTGIGPTVTGQRVTLSTRGQFWDFAIGPTFRTPAGPVVERPAAAFWTYGVGVRYRNMNISHGIVQQSETFPDLNVAINLDLRSHFIGPNLALGFEVMRPLPSGPFAGVSGFVAPGALITDASARQASRCGPCGAASPEFNLVLQRDFDETAFALMAGVNGFVGYQFNPNFSVQAEASYQYLSRLMSFAVPTSPPRQPIGLSAGSSDILSIGGRAVFKFDPIQAVQ